MIGRKIKVLVIDDSIVVRRMLTRILNEDPTIEVIDTAEDPYDAEGKIIKLKPDVLTLDIEMPKMDGITFLKILMEKKPMPVIVMSSLSQEGSKYAMEALNYGAVDVLAKPYGPYSVGNVGPQLVEKVKAAAISKIRRIVRKPEQIQQAHKPSQSRRDNKKDLPKGLSALVNVHAKVAPKIETLPPPTTRLHPRQVILLGASTGGTEALKEVLTLFPKEVPGICAVQHIPPYFSKAFAERLNTICALEVKEAQDGDRLTPGMCLIAPGDYHMLLSWAGNGYKVNLKQGPMVWHQRPAVDILFKTGAECAGKYVTSALLTGMGKDGAEGLLSLKEKGAKTFAQDEATCVVFGMPKAAMELDAAQKMVPLHKMSKEIMDAISQPIH